MIKRPGNTHSNYHAHVYFGEETAAQAQQLCEGASKQFNITMGRVHRKKVGPHPHWSCQLQFTASQFDAIIDWLESNRNGLAILVHGVTGNDLEDHTDHASWLGEPSELNLEVFK